MLSSGFNANAWSLTSLSYAAAETVQAKLDLLELGQQIGGPNEFRTGHYRVSQRLIGGNEKHPIYIKVLVLSDQQIFSFDWIKIKKCFERLLAQELIKAALPFEQFKKECYLAATTKSESQLISNAQEVWVSDVLEVVGRYYPQHIVEIFSYQLKPGDIELKSLSLSELLELETLIDSVSEAELPSATTSVEALQAKLKSPLYWPLSLMTLIKKFTSGVTDMRIVINKTGALSMEKWNSRLRKIKVVEGERLKGEYLPIRLDEAKHWHQVQQRLNLSLSELEKTRAAVWELAQKKHNEFLFSEEGFGRPVGKINSQYVPIPWASDVLEVLEELGVEANALAPLYYDLGVFVDEYDWLLVASKYKLDCNTIENLKRKTFEIALSNQRPVDPVSNLVRPWKDDLYTAITLFRRDAAKLLKKTIVKYSQEELEKILAEKTKALQERLTEDKLYREKLENEINCLKEQIKNMQIEFEQRIENMFNQFMAQQQANNKAHQSSLTLDES